MEFENVYNKYMVLYFKHGYSYEDANEKAILDTRSVFENILKTFDHDAELNSVVGYKGEDEDNG